MKRRLEWAEEQKLLKEQPLPNVETTFGTIDLPCELEQKHVEITEQPIEKVKHRKILKVKKKGKK
jgi:hypothetical protein